MIPSLRPWLAGVACAAALAPLRVHAQPNDELTALRAEVAALREEYENRVHQLELRLEQLEASAPAPEAGAAPLAPESGAAVAATPADAAAGPGGAPSRASAFNPAMSVVLTGTYANLSQDPDDYAIAGFFPGGDEVGPGERSFSLGESEITLSASVDPYFTAALTAAFTGEGELEVEEAFARTTSLPAGLTFKGGRFLSGIGYLNEVHAHAWDFADQPLAYQALFGGQLRQDGVQLKWVAPSDLFLEFGAEAGNGDAYPGTASDGNGFGSYALFAHAGGDVGESIGWRAGLSWVDADATDRAYDDTDALGAAVVNAFSGQSRT
ncbi:MAG: hypothetical protein K0R70_848, partial [Steroidobacteraceae bacterium]|nr:hypothetical protein [Steroidobacteraceae bacterium]